MKNKLLLSLLAFLSCSTFLSCSSTTSGGDGESGTISDQDLDLDESRYGDGNIPSASAGKIFQDIFFEYNSSAVKPEFQEQLRKNAGTMKADASLKVEVEGHCDKRGTSEYNLALGEERAKATASLLINYGAAPSQVSTISYGEEIPLDPADNDSAYAKNRRVHFALGRNKDASKNNRRY